MIYLVGLGLVSLSLILLHFAKRAESRPSAPGWLRAAVRGNTVALSATILLASGLASLLQTAVTRGDAQGIALAIFCAALPFAALWLLARRTTEAPTEIEAPALPPTTGGRLRRGRTEAHPAAAAGQPGAAVKTG